MKQGYISQEYISAFLTNGVKQHQETPLLERSIEGTEHYDVCNIYPFCVGFSSTEWDARDAVSVTIVTDPLDKYTYEPDFTIFDSEEVYKNHSVVDLKQYSFGGLPTNLKRNLRKSDFEVSIVLEPVSYTETLYDLYQNLVERHNISAGAVTNYTKAQIKCFLDTPGAVLVKAVKDSTILGLSLYYVIGDDCYYVLSTQGKIGLDLKSNFLTMHKSILFFKSIGLNRLEIGSSADGSGGEGLIRFKSSFATYQTNNYILRLVQNREVYDKLSEGKSGDFFPVYRSK
jgi:hypothetical protein